jgi:mono/diheme cytochrome c family protein
MGEHRRLWFAAVLLFLAASWAGAESLPEGDPHRGEALYVGTSAFEKGGAPCLGCHGVAGAGLGKAAGASYGPDLTSTYDDFQEMLHDALESMPFPSMEALYVDRPLTEEERTDLIAFLREVSGREPPRIEGSLLVETAAGVGVLFAVLGIFGRSRLKSNRNSRADHSRSQE